MSAAELRRELLRLVQEMENLLHKQTDIRDQLDVTMAAHKLLDAADLVKGK